jgi:oligopeptide/dipeptide ABC transporter ATP-binding protein
VTEEDNPVGDSPRDVILDVRGLKTHFFLRSGIAKAVDGVDLVVRRGRTLGLVGESGCGKSVTAHSILRLIRGPVGRIVDGRIVFRRNGGAAIDLLKLRPDGRDMRRVRGGQIAMVFQEPMTSLNPLYTIGNQIVEAIRVQGSVTRREARQRALTMLEQVRISDPARRFVEYPHQLSGGMRQRVMIAMALSCNPPLLIADEPTTALDVTVQARILELLDGLQDELGTGIILISHNLGVIAQAADDVAVMYLGKVVERADVETLFAGPLHPYTVGLLNSVPVFGRRKKDLQAISGRVPDSTEEIVGCAYAARCPRKMPVCERECPALVAAGEDHDVACWLHSTETKVAE